MYEYESERDRKDYVKFITSKTIVITYNDAAILPVVTMINQTGLLYNLRFIDTKCKAIALLFYRKVRL